MFLMSRFKLATHKEWDGVNELLQTIYSACKEAI